MPRSTPPPRSTRGLRPVLVAFVLLTLALVVGLLIYRGHRPVPLALVELTKKDLILNDGLLYRAGQAVPFSGAIIEFYANGGLKSRSTVSNGLLEGLSQGWYESGQLQIEEHFSAGVSHGLRRKWHDNGHQLSEVMIVDGKLEGIFRQWHPDGSLAEYVELSGGVPDGVSRAFYPSGFLKAEAHLQQGEVLSQKLWKDGERQATGGLAGVPPTSAEN